MMPRDPNLLLLLLGGVVLIAELIALTLRRPIFGLWITMAATIARSFGATNIIALSDMDIGPFDIVAVVLSACVAVAWLRARRVTSGAVLLALTLFAVARGIAEFGLQPAVNSWRELFYFSAVLCFVSAFSQHITLAALTALWRFGATTLMIVAVTVIATKGLGTVGELGSRALNSQQALIVAEAAIFSIAASRPSAWRYGLFCLVVVLLSQQRTVWAMTIIAFAALAMRSNHLGDAVSSRRVRFLVLVAGAVAAGLFLFGPSNLRDSVQEPGAVSTTSGTLGWRVTSGAELLTSVGRKQPFDRLIGQPAGKGFDRVIDGQVWSVSPHNMYLMVLVSLGFVGFASLALLYYRAYRRSKNDPALNAVVSGLLIYSFGYQLGPDQAMLLMVAQLLSSVTARPRASESEGTAAEEATPKKLRIMDHRVELNSRLNHNV